MNNVCTAVGVALFRAVDISFILEYVKVMRPMVQALDVLQSETHCYMGILLPSLVSLKRQLRFVREGQKLASPLVDALLTGIEKRFDGYFARDDLILACITHPEFRLRWLEKDTEAKDRARQILLKAMNESNSSACTNKNTDEAAVMVTETEIGSQNSSTFNSFFSFEESAESSFTMLAEMDLFMSNKSRDVGCLFYYPNVKSVCLRYNTGLPSSASVEWLFSLGGQVLTPRRNRLFDDNFEMLLLLRANKLVQ